MIVIITDSEINLKQHIKLKNTHTPVSPGFTFIVFSSQPVWACYRLWTTRLWASMYQVYYALLQCHLRVPVRCTQYIRRMNPHPQRVIYLEYLNRFVLGLIFLWGLQPIKISIFFIFLVKIFLFITNSLMKGNYI